MSRSGDKAREARRVPSALHNSVPQTQAFIEYKSLKTSTIPLQSSCNSSQFLASTCNPPAHGQWARRLERSLSKQPPKRHPKLIPHAHFWHSWGHPAARRAQEAIRSASGTPFLTIFIEFSSIFLDYPNVDLHGFSSDFNRFSFKSH